MRLPCCGLCLLLWALCAVRCQAVCARRGHPPRCCSGRNNACTGESPAGTTCYCDTYCQRSADCCEDYGGQCGGSASNCMVGPWGMWSDCNSRCGIGSRERARQVTVPPRSGGNPCPDLRQRRGCYGEDASCHTSKEVAKILPGSFKRDFRDPWRRRHTMAQERTPSYCVYFRMKHVGPGCRLQGWSRMLVQELLVCVECQVDAVGSVGRCLGDGVAGTRTFWAAASLPGCQGSWVQEDLREDCMCQLPSLLFV